MLFFSSILCGDISTPTITPTAINDINYLQASGIYYDDIYITRNVTYTPTTEIPQDWDEDTIFHAKYDGDLTAGNVNFRYKDIEDGVVLVKRRQTSGFHWITLQANGVYDPEDLRFKFIDYTAAPDTEYEYALVPIIGGTEADYYRERITPTTERLVIVDNSALWATIVTNGFCDSQRNTAPGVVDTMNNKYPTIIHNGMANYDTVSVTAGWFPAEEDDCTLMIGEEYNHWVSQYAKRFMDFLTNRKVKMLKNVDGRMWLCYVTTLPSNTARDVYWDREINFGVTEIGDVEGEKALYDAGLIGAGEEWWSSE